MRIEIDPNDISSDTGDKGCEIYVPGYAHDSAAAEGYGTQVHLEIIKGELAVHVWDGGESPVASIKIPRNKKVYRKDR